MHDAELMRCRDCRVYDPDNQPSVQRDVARMTDEEWAKKFYVVWVYTGQWAYGVRLSTELALCPTHRAQAEAEVVQ